MTVWVLIGVLNFFVWDSGKICVFIEREYKRDDRRIGRKVCKRSGLMEILGLLFYEVVRMIGILIIFVIIFNFKILLKFVIF